MEKNEDQNDRLETTSSAPSNRIESILVWLSQHARNVAISLAIVNAMAGAFYSFWLGNHLPYVDEVDYYAIATNIVSLGEYTNDGIEPNGDRAPAYPLLLSAFVALGANVAILRIVNFFMLSLTIYLLYLICQRQQDSLAGGLAAILVLGYPVLFYAAGTLFPQTMGGMLFILTLFLLSRAETLLGFALAGLSAGLLVLTIPMFLFVMVVVAGWMLVVRANQRVASVVAVAISAMLVVSAWTLRNYLVFNAFVLVSTAGGATLLWGNSSEATIGSSEVEFLARSYDESAGMDAVAASKYKRELAYKYIRENKVEFLGFYCLKVANFFNFYNEHYAKSEESALKTVIMALTYCPLLLMLAVRIFLRRTYPPSQLEWLLIAIYLTTPFVYAFFHTRIRYRLPYDLALIAIVAMFLSQWVALRWRCKINRRHATE